MLIRCCGCAREESRRPLAARHVVRNLYQAFRRARVANRGRPDVAAFEFDLEENKCLGFNRSCSMKRTVPRDSFFPSPSPA
jgi:hypothetical protein